MVGAMMTDLSEASLETRRALSSGAVTAHRPRSYTRRRRTTDHGGRSSDTSRRPERVLPVVHLSAGLWSLLGVAIGFILGLVTEWFRAHQTRLREVRGRRDRLLMETLIEYQDQLAVDFEANLDLHILSSREHAGLPGHRGSQHRFSMVDRATNATLRIVVLLARLQGLADLMAANDAYLEAKADVKSECLDLDNFDEATRRMREAYGAAQVAASNELRKILETPAVEQGEA